VAAGEIPGTTQQVTLPQLGESVSGGTIVAWLVEVGDEIELDDPIAEISTDKVDTEIPSPVTGTVTRLLVEVDAEVEVGQAILEMASSAATPATGDAPSAAEPTPATEPDPGAASRAPAPPRGSSSPSSPTSDRPPPDRDRRLSPRVRRLLGEHGLEPEGIRGTGPGGRITPADVQRAAAGPGEGPSWRGLRLSPLVRRLLREHDLDPRRLSGSGPGGRVTPDDVRAAAAATPDEPTAATPTPEPASATAPASAPSRVASPPGGSDDRQTVEPLTRTRKVIAERMMTSLHTTAQLTAAVDADVTRVMHVRARIRDVAKARYGFAPSPLAFIAKATARALQRHPVINASIDTDAGTVTYHRAVNLGIAVDTPNGLMVPVLHDAHELGVMALQERINDLAARARDRKLRPDDVTGGTFTITNTGSAGTLFDTPILNPPEAAILATPIIEKRPVIVQDDAGNDQIAIRHRTYLCLSYDHRLIDGADAARFLTDLAHQLDATDWTQEVAELT
jgi:pyruvate dehydrogenase E2 component (dihydrolipoamide acetyltransferase)